METHTTQHLTKTAARNGLANEPPSYKNRAVDPVPNPAPPPHREKASPHELMIKTNHYLIKGGALTEAQKATIVRRLLASVSNEQTKQRFYTGVRFPRNTDGEGRRMYPLFYIPCYNGGKKFQTVLPLSPKTHILSANAYELEIIRLLHLFAPDNPQVSEMVRQTAHRLKTTCFGYYDCAQGECFHTALVTLRFLAAAWDETAWMRKRIRFFQQHMDEKRQLKGKGIHGNILWYYWLCLSELPLDMAEPEILRYKDKIIGALSRSSVMNSENDRIINPVLVCVARNALCRLPDYAHLKNRLPYINEKDGRLYFNVEDTR